MWRVTYVCMSLEITWHSTLLYCVYVIRGIVQCARGARNGGASTMHCHACVMHFHPPPPG